MLKFGIVGSKAPCRAFVRVSRAIVEKIIASTQNIGPTMLGQTGRISGNMGEEDKAGVCDADSSDADPITPDTVPPVQRRSHGDGSDRKEQEAPCVWE